MAGYKRPTFGEEDAPDTAAPVVEAAPAPKSSGYKRPTFEEAPAPKAETKKEKGWLEGYADRKAADLQDMKSGASSKKQMDTNKSMFNGLMFGMGDRLRAATGIGVEGENYDERLKNALTERAEYNKENPIGHFLTEGLPGVLSGAAVLGPIKSGLSAVAPAVTEFAAGSGVLPALTRLAGNMSLGAGFGAVSGAGSAEAGKVAEGAKNGAIVGAIAPVAMQGAGKMLSGAGNLATPMLQKVAMMMGVTDPEKWAQKKMVNEMLAAGETPDSIVLKMRDMANKGAWQPQKADFVGPPPEIPAKPVVMADALPAKALGMLKQAGSKGDAADVIQSRLGPRNVEAPDRIANDIATNISDRTGASAEFQRIVDDRAAQTKPLYDAAMARGTPSADEIIPFFNNRVRNALFHEVESTQRAIGQPFQGKMTIDPQTQEFKVVEVPSIRDLHEMRKHLSAKKQNLWDDEAGKYKGWENVGGVKLNSQQIDDQLKSLTKQIEDLTPDGQGGSFYAKARSIFADESSVAEALTKGTHILKTRPEDVAIEFRKLGSEAERDAYRAGISSALSDKAGSTASGATILKNIFGNKNIRSKLEEIYPNDQARALFPKQMAAEQKMQDTTKVLAPRVASHDFLESGGDASLPAALANFMAGRPVAGAANAARFIAGQADKMHPIYGEQLAKIGMMSLPEAESFAATVARQRNNPFGKAGRAIMGGLSAMGEATPYVTGSVLARQDQEGTLERLRNGN